MTDMTWEQLREDANSFGVTKAFDAVAMNKLTKKLRCSSQEINNVMSGNTIGMPSNRVKEITRAVSTAQRQANNRV